MTKITLQQGDITTLEVDAIVNAANESLLGGGGVDGAIHRAAGHELQIECRTLNGCKTGKAKITRGYNLPAKHVIHTVGPVYLRETSGRSARLLEECYRNCLLLAIENNLKSIAFPCISTGIFGYPIEDAATIATLTVLSVVKKNSDVLDEVIFVTHSDRDTEVYKKIVG